MQIYPDFHAFVELSIIGAHALAFHGRPRYTNAQWASPPVRIDITATISGLDFEEAWNGRVEGTLGDLPVSFPSAESYIKKKRASGRPKHLADIDELTSAS